MQKGTTQLFRTQQQFDHAARDIAVLERSGVPYLLLESADIASVEPALAAVADTLVGALHLPNDQTGDCNMFTRNLARMAEGLGVEFRFGSTVHHLQSSADQITGVQVDGQLERADYYVMALGSYSTNMLAPLGIKMPVYPLKRLLVDCANY